MKQDIDTATLELPFMGEVITPDNSKVYHRFFIGLTDGTEIEWRGLSRKQARDMYAYTQQSQPSNMTGCGWEECK
jgi:hypothetical protein